MKAGFVYFDLEFSGTDLEEIVQIAAVGSRNADPNFSVYSYPEGPISSYCTANVHGIQKASFRAYKTLYKDGEELDDIYPWDEAIDMFFEWLDDNFPDGVILVAHGAFQNDARILIKNLKKSGWGDEQIENVILGFCDTIISFQKGFTGLKRFGLANLMDTFDLKFEANHDAVEDSFALLDLVRRAKPRKTSQKWYDNFLMSGYKPVSFYL